MVGTMLWLSMAFIVGDTTAITSPSRCLDRPPINSGARDFFGRVWYEELEGRIEPQVFISRPAWVAPPAPA